jgi:hypothetical protein
LYFFRLIRNIEALIYPLQYPEPQGEFYGYDRKSIPPWYLATIERGTKELVASICWAATAIVALQTGRYIGKKADGIKAYEELIGGEWAMLVRDIYQKCKLQWKYLVPEDEDNRSLLRNLCQQTPAFENHYLAIYKKYLLAQLHCEHEADKLFAIKRLGEVIYPDEEILSTLHTFEKSDNEELRQATKETIGRMQVVQKT